MFGQQAVCCICKTLYIISVLFFTKFRSVSIVTFFCSNNTGALCTLCPETSIPTTVPFRITCLSPPNRYPRTAEGGPLDFSQILHMDITAFTKSISGR